MSIDVTIRSATIEDFDPIAAFDLWGGNRKKEIQQDVVFVAELENQIVGYITLDTSFYERPFLRYICIKREFRRQTIGELFLEFAENKYRGKRIFSSTESDNLPMLRLFEKRGYRLAGWIECLQERAEIVYCKDVKQDGEGTQLG